MSEPVSMFSGADPRCEVLLQALRAVVYACGSGIPVPAVLGVLRLLEHQIIKEQS